MEENSVTERVIRMNVIKTLTLNGKTYILQDSSPTAAVVTLYASAWVGETSPYEQVVVIPGVTTHTKVDLQPTVAQLNTLRALSIGFFAVNEEGVVTVYAVGHKPTEDFTFQVTTMEVEA